VVFHSQELQLRQITDAGRGARLLAEAAVDL